MDLTELIRLINRCFDAPTSEELGTYLDDVHQWSQADLRIARMGTPTTLSDARNPKSPNLPKLLAETQDMIRSYATTSQLESEPWQLVLPVLLGPDESTDLLLFRATVSVVNLITTLEFILYRPSAGREPERLAIEVSPKGIRFSTRLQASKAGS